MHVPADDLAMEAAAFFLFPLAISKSLAAALCFVVVDGSANVGISAGAGVTCGVTRWTASDLATSPLSKLSMGVLVTGGLKDEVDDEDLTGAKSSNSVA